MLEKKIEQLNSYFDGFFKIGDDQQAVRLIAPKNWIIYPKKTDNYEIKAYNVVDNNIDKVLLVGIGDIKVGEIMDFAIEIMLRNVENEQKKKLFEERVKELALLFDKNPLSYAQNIIFKYEKPKKIRKKNEPELPTNDDKLEAFVKDNEILNNK